MCETVLAGAAWTVLEGAHVDRVDEFLRPYRARAGQAHPVWDFLFAYYSLRPGQLRRWHPGYGVVLGGDAAARYLDRTGYGAHSLGVTVTAGYLRTRAESLRFVAGLLRATAARAARLNCFGLHEWAMVYKTSSVRHAQVPLRLGAAATDAVVESMPLRCSHFDAFRFFTGPAAGRNELPLSREGQAGAEQPGCIHAAMDLYKWCYKLLPLVNSDTLIAALELAYDARVLDMCASPYDLRSLGYEPVRIEIPSGRADYVRQQALLAERAASLRHVLLTQCGALLDAAAIGS